MVRSKNPKAERAEPAHRAEKTHEKTGAAAPAEPGQSHEQPEPLDEKSLDDVMRECPL